MWPDDRDLPTEVEAAFGADLTADPGTWSWTDLSSRLRNTPISVRVPDGQLSPRTCSVTLDNDDGALTPLQPTSVYWPNVELGTPLRVRLRRAEDAFARTVTGGWGVSDSGQAWTTGGTAAADFSVSAGVARHSHTTVNNIRRTVLGTALADVEQVVEVAPSALLTGAALVTGLLFRYQDSNNYYWLRCEFNAGGTSVMLKISRCVGGSISDLAVLNPVPSVAYAANSYLRVRASVVGSTLAMKVWPVAGAEPAGWQLTATDTSIAAAGSTGLQSWLVSGNTNTLPVTALHKNYAARVDRFSGFADQWEPTYLPTGVVGQMASAVRVTASGILRRLQQGDQPDESPLRRAIGGSSPVAYWPAEDGATSQQAGSAIPGHLPLAVTGSLKFVEIEDSTFGTNPTLRYGTAALVDLSGGGSLSATVPGDVTTATASRWTVAVVAAVNYGLAASDVVVVDVATPGGTYVRWQLIIRKATLRTQVVAYDATGAATTVIDDPGVYPNINHYDVSVWQNGGSISVGYGWYLGSYSITGSVAGTLAGVRSVSANPTRVTSSGEMPFGHIAVWARHPIPVEEAIYDSYGGFVYGAATSWYQEAATDRIRRLCAESSISLDMPSVPAEAIQRMGWQPVGTFVGLLQEAVEVDGGLLYEQGFGLGYTPRVARYNPPVTLEVDLATYRVSDSGGDVLSPTYDDQDIRNRWTVSRRDGSFAVADDTASQRRGVYSDSAELNLASDSGLLDQASWRVHLTTVVELREETFPIDLAANPDLLDGWLSCRAGSRVQRTNPPAQYGPGPLDRLVAGWSETVGPRSWMVQVTPASASPWDVATADGPQRAPAEGTTLTADITAAALSVQITSTAANGRWTTDPAAFPMAMRIGGERVTATGITGTGLTQTVTLSARAVNGVSRAWPAGTEVNVWQPAVAPL